MRSIRGYKCKYYCKCINHESLAWREGRGIFVLCTMEIWPRVVAFNILIGQFIFEWGLQNINIFISLSTSALCLLELGSFPNISNAILLFSFKEEKEVISFPFHPCCLSDTCSMIFMGGLCNMSALIWNHMSWDGFIIKVTTKLHFIFVLFFLLWFFFPFCETYKVK